MGKLKLCFFGGGVAVKHDQGKHIRWVLFYSALGNVLAYF